MGRLLIVAMVAISAFSGPMAGTALAGFLDGNDLHSLCSDSPVVAGYYVVGVIDNEVDQDRAVTADGQVVLTREFLCIPDGVVGNQARDVVCRYLDENPEDRHWPASGLTYNAIRVVWPCPSQ